jgi:hypothetical protein
MTLPLAALATSCVILFLVYFIGTDVIDESLEEFPEYFDGYLVDTK